MRGAGPFEGYRERRRARRLALAAAAAGLSSVPPPWITSRGGTSNCCSSDEDVGDNHHRPSWSRRRSSTTMNFGDENSRNHKFAIAMGLGFEPQFGDSQTADVILHLKSNQAPPSASCVEDEETVETTTEIVTTPLYVHSKALQRSEFFEARLSKRWSSGSEASCSVDGGSLKTCGVVELTLANCKDPQTYVRCIQLLYVPDRVKHICFMSVEDALSILEVAAELLFHDCVASCMRYLESVPWTLENENAIRTCVSNLHLQPSEDLAARLCSSESVSDVKPVDIMQGVLGELLTIVTTGAPSKARDITERVLLANIQPTSSLAFASVNEVTLFKEFSRNFEILKVQLRKFANFFSWNGHQVNIACSALRWILDELFILQIADEAVRMFSEEKELAQLMVSRIYQNPFTDTLFFILVRMLKALQHGDILSPRPTRLTLLTTWLPVVAKLGNDDDNFTHDETQRNLEDGLSALVESLPMVDQEIIFRIWIGACLKCRRAWPNLTEPFETWCRKLRETHRNTNIESITSESS